MGQVIAVTSGKGGVGKSSFCVCTAYALAARGNSVLVVELDSGLRSLDIMMGLTAKTVYDVGDVVMCRCEPARAVVQSDMVPNVCLLPASARPDITVYAHTLARLLGRLDGTFDVVLVDTPAGLGESFKAAVSVCDLTVVIATPDAVSVRDASAAAMYSREIADCDVRLVINKVYEKDGRKNAIEDLDMVIDGVGARLLGVVPFDDSLSKTLTAGEMPAAGRLSARVFDNIAGRLSGRDIELAIR